MTAAYATEPALGLKIHCPVSPETLAKVLAGDGEAFEADPALAPILAEIRADNPLGDFGIYDGVIEIAAGWESFRPSAKARPTLGAAGARALSPTAILTVYAPADCDRDAFDAAVGRILAAHPWEIPVAEIFETRLLRRAG